MARIMDITSRQADELLKYATEEFGTHFTAEYQKIFFTVVTPSSREFISMYQPERPRNTCDMPSDKIFQDELRRYEEVMAKISIIEKMVEAL